jgi:hypothetical protein
MTSPTELTKGILIFMVNSIGKSFAELLAYCRSDPRLGDIDLIEQMNAGSHDPIKI